MPSQPRFLLLLTICALVPNLAFSFLDSGLRSFPKKNSFSTSAHYAHPNQGAQLIAAQNAAYAHGTEKKKEVKESSSGVLLPFEQMFSLASLGLRKREADCFSSAFPPSLFGSARRGEDDIVLYPVVGFRWVGVDCESKGSKKYQILPMSLKASMPIMRIPEEEVYGWFNPCCTLGDIFDDYEFYCGRWV